MHRLDRGVSGLLVMAKSLDVAEQIRDQFAARKPERKYIAIVLGHLENPQGTIESHLATDEQLNRYSVEEGAEGELAITHYRQTLELRNATMVEVQLETGRRNQIRVHMSEMGNPILVIPVWWRPAAFSLAVSTTRLACRIARLCASRSRRTDAIPHFMAR